MRSVGCSVVEASHSDLAHASALAAHLLLAYVVHILVVEFHIFDLLELHIGPSQGVTLPSLPCDLVAQNFVDVQESAVGDMLGNPPQSC